MTILKVWELALESNNLMSRLTLLLLAKFWIYDFKIKSLNLNLVELLFKSLLLIFDNFLFFKFFLNGLIFLTLIIHFVFWRWILIAVDYHVANILVGLVLFLQSEKISELIVIKFDWNGIGSRYNYRLETMSIWTIIFG